MTKRSLWIGITLCLALYFGSAWLLNTPSTASALPAGASFSTAPQGAQALYTLVSQPPARGAEQTVLLPQTGLIPAETQLMIEPSVPEDTATDVAWLRLVRHGLHLIVLSDTPMPLLRDIGIQVQRVSTHTGNPGVTADIRSPSGRRYRIRFDTPSIIRAQRNTALRWIYTTGSTANVVGITESVGKGSVTVFSLPSIAYNARIAQADNLDVLLTLLQPADQRLGFVETIHGDVVVPGTGAFLGNGGVAAFAILGLALLLWLWAEGKRFGAIVRVPVQRESASLALADAVAVHLIRNKAYAYAAEAYAQLVRSRHDITHMDAASTTKRVSALQQRVAQLQREISPKRRTPNP